MDKVRIKLVRSDSVAPTYGSDSAAGADIYADIDEEMTISPHTTVIVPSGFCIEIPEGYAGLVCARSGLSAKRGLAPANKVGVIDSDYRGEVCVSLHNHGTEPAVVAPHERIAQLVIVPVLTPAFEIAESLTSTERGSGGFGSTGTK